MLVAACCVEKQDMLYCSGGDTISVLYFFRFQQIVLYADAPRVEKMICILAISKMCFLLYETLFAAKNRLARKGIKHLRSRRLGQTLTSFKGLLSALIK